MSFVALPTSSVNPFYIAYEFNRRRSNKKRFSMHEYEQALHDAIFALGGNGEIANNLVQDWVKKPYTSMLRWAVSRVAGEDHAKEFKKVQERARALAIKTTDADALNKQQNDLYIMDAAYRYSDDPLILSTVIAMSSLCQAFAYLQDKKTTMTLYRGVCCEQGYRIHETALIRRHEVSVATDHTTSFTTCIDTAKGFAHGAGMTGHKGDQSMAVLLTMNVPLHSIVATHHVFLYLRYESECIVATDGHVKIPVQDISVVP